MTARPPSSVPKLHSFIARTGAACTLATMPARSRQQQKAAGAALGAKRRHSAQGLRGASRGMFQSMNERELRDLAKTERKKLPWRAAKKKRS